MEPDNLNDLSQQLRLPQPPADLETQLKSNFYHQLAQERRQTQRSFYFPALAAAMLLTLGVVLYQWWLPPDFIQAAQLHTLHEAALHGHFASPDYTTWRTRLGLPDAPNDAELVLIKDCAVQGELFKHLRFQYADGNSVDLLVAQRTSSPIMGKGGNALHGFWLAARRDSLWMLAMYRDAVAEERAQHLVQHWTTVKPVS